MYIKPMVKPGYYQVSKKELVNSTECSYTIGDQFVIVATKNNLFKIRKSNVIFA